jgi:hypothetical protein
MRDFHSREPGSTPGVEVRDSFEIAIFSHRTKNNPETGKVEKTEGVPANCWKFTKIPKTEHPTTGKARIFLTSVGLAEQILEIPSKLGIFQNKTGKCGVKVRLSSFEWGSGCE